MNVWLKPDWGQCSDIDPALNEIDCKEILLPIPTQWHLLTPLGKKPFENTVGKGEIARNEQFLLLPQCFLPIWTTFCHFRQIWNCRLQPPSVLESLKFVVWERVKLSRYNGERYFSVIFFFRVSVTTQLLLYYSVYNLERNQFHTKGPPYSNVLGILYEDNGSKMTERQIIPDTNCGPIYPVPDDKILSWSKLKEIADDILKWFKMKSKCNIR